MLQLEMLHLLLFMYVVFFLKKVFYKRGGVIFCMGAISGHFHSSEEWGLKYSPVLCKSLLLQQVNSVVSRTYHPVTLLSRQENMVEIYI